MHKQVALVPFAERAGKIVLKIHVKNVPPLSFVQMSNNAVSQSLQLSPFHMHGIQAQTPLYLLPYLANKKGYRARTN